MERDDDESQTNEKVHHACVFRFSFSDVRRQTRSRFALQNPFQSIFVK
jgi:hypothetical protein